MKLTLDEAGRVMNVLLNTLNLADLVTRVCLADDDDHLPEKEFFDIVSRVALGSGVLLVDLLEPMFEAVSPLRVDAKGQALFEHWSGIKNTIKERIVNSEDCDIFLKDSWAITVTTDDQDDNPSRPV